MPELVIVAGPNGSGKSTLTEPTRLARLGLSFPENYINADEIARAFRETHSDLPQLEREQLAFQEARQRRKQYREQKVSYAFETVFSHPSTLLDIQQARASGYFVTLLFVTTGVCQVICAFSFRRFAFRFPRPSFPLKGSDLTQDESTTRSP